MMPKHVNDACRGVCYAINGAGEAAALAPSSCIVYFEYFFIFPGASVGRAFFGATLASLNTLVLWQCPHSIPTLPRAPHRQIRSGAVHMGQWAPNGCPGGARGGQKIEKKYGESPALGQCGCNLKGARTGVQHCIGGPATRGCPIMSKKNSWCEPGPGAISAFFLGCRAPPRPRGGPIWPAIGPPYWAAAIVIYKVGNGVLGYHPNISGMWTCQ